MFEKPQLIIQKFHACDRGKEERKTKFEIEVVKYSYY